MADTAQREQQRVSLIGARFGKLVALEPTDTINTRARDRHWMFRCDCGEVIERGMNTVRTTMRRGGIPKCILCDSRGRKCTICGEAGHYKLTCHKRDKGPSKVCRECHNLPHRRPKAGCHGCGLPFEEDHT